MSQSRRPVQRPLAQAELTIRVESNGTSTVRARYHDGERWHDQAGFFICEEAGEAFVHAQIVLKKMTRRMDYVQLGVHQEHEDAVAKARAKRDAESRERKFAEAEDPERKAVGG